MSFFIHKPAPLFFGIAILTLVITWLYDYYHYNAECMASFHCVSYFPTIYYFLYFILIVFWSWIISLFTKYKYDILAIIALVVPFVGYLFGFSLTNWNIVTPTFNNNYQYMV